jgi:hypothetical protein
MHAIEKMGPAFEVDKLTGPVIGIWKSATFRTMDVGLDTTVNVIISTKHCLKETLYRLLSKDCRSTLLDKQRYRRSIDGTKELKELTLTS